MTQFQSKTTFSPQTKPSKQASHSQHKPNLEKNSTFKQTIAKFSERTKTKFYFWVTRFYSPKDQTRCKQFQFRCLHFFRLNVKLFSHKIAKKETLTFCRLFESQVHMMILFAYKECFIAVRGHGKEVVFALTGPDTPLVSSTRKRLFYWSGGRHCTKVVLMLTVPDAPLVS